MYNLVQETLLIADSNIMDCIRQNHTYKLEHTMFVIAIQEQHVIIAVLHLEVAMRPKPFN
jgi:hypothetical protein